MQQYVNNKMLWCIHTKKHFIAIKNRLQGTLNDMENAPSIIYSETNSNQTCAPK